MEKSIYTHEYTVFLKLLKNTREVLGITQESLAIALGETQTFVSKCERGERRLDVIELHFWCTALGIPMTEFIRELDEALC